MGLGYRFYDSCLLLWFLSKRFTNVPRFPLNALYKCTKIPSQHPLQMYQDSINFFHLL